MKFNKRTIHTFIILIPIFFAIMLSIDKVISTNENLIKTTEGGINYGIIKEYIYENPVHLMLSWWQSHIFIILILFQRMKYIS